MWKNNTHKQGILSLEALFSLTLLTIFAIPIIQISHQFILSSYKIDDSIRMNKALYQAVVSKGKYKVSSDYQITCSSHQSRIQYKGKIIDIQKK